MTERCDICNLDLADKYALNGHLLGKKHLMNVERVEKRKALIARSVFVRAPPFIIQNSNLLPFFSQFGPIQRYDCNRNHIIIEFEYQDTASFLLNHQISFSGYNLQIRPRTAENPRITQPFGRRNKTSENKEDNDNVADVLSYKHLKDDLEKKCTFQEQLNFLLDKIQPTEQQMKNDYSPICATLDNIFQSTFPNWKTYRFGSTVSGLCFKNSDLDIYLETGMTIHEDEESQEKARKKIFMQVKNTMFRNRHIFDKIVPIPRAKTPIIKFNYKPKNIPCDLSFKHILGLYNSQLIRQYLSLDPRFKPCMMVLKYWVKGTQLTQAGRISNYSLVMLFFFYLQQFSSPKLISYVREIYEELTLFGEPNSNLQYLKLELANENRNTDGSCSAAVSSSNNNNSIGNSIPEILHGFFQFYKTFNFKENVICPLNGMAHPKKTFSYFNTSAAVAENPKRHNENAPDGTEGQAENKGEGEIKKAGQAIDKKRNFMCVQDPIELNHNITSNVTRSITIEFQHLCSEMAKICSKNITNDEGASKNLLPELLSYVSNINKKQHDKLNFKIFLQLAQKPGVNDKKEAVAQDKEENDKKEENKKQGEETQTEGKATDTEESEERKNDEEGREKAFQELLAGVRQIFVRVLKLEIQSTNDSASKQLKVEANSDVHSNDEGKVTWHCTSRYSMWRQRKTMKEAGAHCTDRLEKEAAISEALCSQLERLQQLENCEVKKNTLNFACNFERSKDEKGVKVDKVAVTMNDMGSASGCFQEMAQFFRNQLYFLLPDTPEVVRSRKPYQQKTPRAKVQNRPPSTVIPKENEPQPPLTLDAISIPQHSDA